MGKRSGDVEARQRREVAKAIARLVFRLFPAAPLGLLWIGGCAAPTRVAGDPLLGGGPPQVASGPAHAPPPAPQGPLPSLAAPSQLTSNAALAAGPPPAEDSHDLRIGDTPPKAEGAPGIAPAAMPVVTPAVTPPITPVFHRADPVAMAPPLVPPQQTLLSRAFGPPGGSQVTTYEQAQSVLTARGVSWQRLETLGDQGQWKFTCSIPNRQNKYISRTYEATGRDYMTAVRAVLDQIEREP